MLEKYINPFTDFGFKKIFGEEVNKDLLIDFLNQLLLGKATIKNLTYLKTEHLGNTAIDRKAIFDLYCENEKGEKFIVELQKVKQEYFKDRSIYYATFPIQQQAIRGEWNYELKAIYTIGIMDFCFDESPQSKKKFIHEIKLTEIHTQKVFYEKLTFFYLEMPKFDKEEKDLKTSFDKWLYLIRNLPKLQNRPAALQEKVFKKLFEVAEIAKFNPKDMMMYEDSLKVYRDLKNSLDTAFNEGIVEGRIEGRLEGEKLKTIDIARKALKKGLSVADIKDLTGLSETEIEQLKKQK